MAIYLYVSLYHCCHDVIIVIYLMIAVVSCNITISHSQDMYIEVMYQSCLRLRDHGVYSTEANTLDHPDPRSATGPASPPGQTAFYIQRQIIIRCLKGKCPAVPRWSAMDQAVSTWWIIIDTGLLPMISHNEWGNVADMWHICWPTQAKVLNAFSCVYCTHAGLPQTHCRKSYRKQQCVTVITW